MFVNVPATVTFSMKILRHDLLKVRKTSQAALLVLLEQGLADTRDVEDQVSVVNFHLVSCNNVLC